jgi:hypothetical protein
VNFPNGEGYLEELAALLRAAAALKEQKAEMASESFAFAAGHFGTQCP